MLQRDKAPDAIKGICIILMVFGHIAYVGDWKENLNGINDFIYTFHMPVFLIISGYFFTIESYAEGKITKLIKRLVVPYVIFISLYLMGLIFIKRFGIETSNNPPRDFSHFINTILFKPYGGYWFLHSLIIIQLASIVSAFLVNSFASKENVFVTVFLCSLFLLLFASGQGVIGSRTVAYFLMGVLLRRVSGDFVFSLRLKLVLGGLLILTGVLSGDGLYEPFSAYEITWCLLITCFLWSFFNGKDGVVIGGLAWIGRNTLVILVLHSAFVVALKPFNSLFLSIDPTGVLQAILVTVITLISCLISANLSDRLNFSRFIFGTDVIYSKK